MSMFYENTSESFTFKTRFLNLVGLYGFPRISYGVRKVSEDWVNFTMLRSFHMIVLDFMPIMKITVT